MTGTLSVPWLRSGTGSTPAHGGCILQVIDWIDRNQWSDEPTCVHPVLRRLAIRANDTLPDDQRQKLLDLAPRLMGTNSDDNMLSVSLAVFCARQVLSIWEKKYPQDDRPRKSIEAAEAWLAEPTEENRRRAIKARYAALDDAALDDAAFSADAAAYAAFSADAAAYAAFSADAAAYAAFSAAFSADAAGTVYDLLVATLDEYDRLTSRTEVKHVDLSPAAVAMSEAKA